VCFQNQLQCALRVILQKPFNDGVLASAACGHGNGATILVQAFVAQVAESPGKFFQRFFLLLVIFSIFLLLVIFNVFLLLVIFSIFLLLVIFKVSLLLVIFSVFLLLPLLLLICLRCRCSYRCTGRRLGTRNLPRASLWLVEGIPRKPKEGPGRNGRPKFSNHQSNKKFCLPTSSWLFLGLPGNPFDWLKRSPETWNIA
jgi:hypothetical protein